MNDYSTTVSSYPVYKTKSEVLKAANENRDFFDSYDEALRTAWKFYRP